MTQTPSPPRRVKLPGVDAKLVTDSAVTVCGTGTTGLGGDLCAASFHNQAAQAYQQWLEYKASMPQAPHRGSGTSPRERYQRAQREHAEALAQFEAKQQRKFEALHKEKKEIMRRLAADKSQQLLSQFSSIQEERHRRRERLEEYSRAKAQMSRDEKELASAIADIWRAAGHEEEKAWEAWVHSRREHLEKERAEFVVAQQRHTEEVNIAASTLRQQRDQRAKRLEKAREEELKIRRAEVAQIRKANEAGRLRSQYACEEAKRSTVEALKKEADSWNSLRADNSRRRSESNQNAQRAAGSLQHSLNAVEESILSKQHAADAVRDWKRSRFGKIALQSEGDHHNDRGEALIPNRSHTSLR